MNTSQASPITREQATATLGAREERQLRGRVGRWARWCFKLSENDFEDCYQGAWLRMMEHLRAGRPVRNLEGFLRWEVANRWKMELRRRRRRPSVAFDDCPEGALDNALGPDPAEQVQRRAELLELVGSMEPRRRQVLVLRNACGHTPAEVCRLLGIARHAYREEHAEALNEIYGRRHG